MYTGSGVGKQTLLYIVCAGVYVYVWYVCVSVVYSMHNMNYTFMWPERGLDQTGLVIDHADLAAMQ